MSQKMIEGVEKYITDAKLDKSAAEIIRQTVKEFGVEKLAEISPIVAETLLGGGAGAVIGAGVGGLANLIARVPVTKRMGHHAALGAAVGAGAGLGSGIRHSLHQRDAELNNMSQDRDYWKNTAKSVNQSMVPPGADKRAGLAEMANSATSGLSNAYDSARSALLPHVGSTGADAIMGGGVGALAGAGLGGVFGSGPLHKRLFSGAAIGGAIGGAAGAGFGSQGRANARASLAEQDEKNQKYTDYVAAVRNQHAVVNQAKAYGDPTIQSRGTGYYLEGMPAPK
jgi:hypothetical protein